MASNVNTQGSNQSDTVNENVDNAINDIINDVTNDVSSTSMPPPPSYESACATGARHNFGATGQTEGQSEEKLLAKYREKPPSYSEASGTSFVAKNNNKGLATVPDSSRIPHVAYSQNVVAYTTQFATNNDQISMSQYPSSLTNQYPPYPPAVFTSQSTASTQGLPRQTNYNNCVVVTQIPRTQGDMDRTGAEADFQSWIYLLVSVTTCMCCSPLFGLFGICFSLAAKQAYDRGDTVKAQAYGNRAITCCMTGICITIIVVIIRWSLT